jgi:2-C-methyl-D-erythritol 4-phosphate cytidylyltransferase / 2-C-methyl-D-erythritol 2,4-cyclodiphosphate synthase
LIVPETRRLWAIVPAAGRGERFASTTPHNLPKQYTPLLGSSVLEWSLRALLAEPRIHAIVVVLAAGDSHWPQVAARLNSPKLLTTVGGAQRQDSVMNGLEFLASRAAADDWILVHDAARPCLSSTDIGALADALQEQSGGSALDIRGTSELSGAVLAAPIVDTVKRALPGSVETVDRTGLWRALTPQVFAFAQLRSALTEAVRDGVAVTDEAQAMERMGIRAALVGGSPFNIKVTRAEDLSVAAGILQMAAGELETGESSQMRVGQGMDVHAFGAGDHVMLGGVRIAHSQGVVAHSDGDVVIHALCDALLGAMGDGDIGQHFPDTDPRYRGADSRVFLRAVAERMQAARLHLVNADITVLAEAPRIAAHRSAMAVNLAADLNVSSALVNIKATTTERLGFVGRKEGLAALASVLLAR